MPKTKKPAAKKGPQKKAKKTAAHAATVLTPLEGNPLCSYGCGLVADGNDWDTNAPVSWRCLFNNAKATRDAQA